MGPELEWKSLIHLVKFTYKVDPIKDMEDFSTIVISLILWIDNILYSVSKKSRIISNIHGTWDTIIPRLEIKPQRNNLDFIRRKLEKTHIIYNLYACWPCYFTFPILYYRIEILTDEKYMYRHINCGIIFNSEKLKVTFSLSVRELIK